MSFQSMLDRITKVRQAMDLTHDGLGEALCKAATDGVQACLAGEHAPDGSSWKELSDRYEGWKSFHYPGNQISLLHGLMDNPREVAGEPGPNTPERAIVTYGVSEQARLEAEWFQKGSGRPGHGAPERPFWGFTDDSRQKIKEILEARLKSA